MFTSPECPIDTGLNEETDLCESDFQCIEGTAFDESSDLCLVQLVCIDIKPGSDPNSFNINNGKIVTVAILGTDSFDVTQVDVDPLSDAPTFGGSTPQTPVHIGYDDLKKKDGNIDLTMQYEIQNLGFSLGDTQGCVMGFLADGTPILGCDSVNLKGK